MPWRDDGYSRSDRGRQSPFRDHHNARGAAPQRNTTTALTHYEGTPHHGGAPRHQMAQRYGRSPIAGCDPQGALCYPGADVYESHYEAPHDERRCDGSIGIAVEVLHCIRDQLASVGDAVPQSAPRMTPSGQGGVAYMSGAHVRVDPNGRYCNLCGTPYAVQIAQTHFEGKRHRQHILRLLHAEDYAELSKQAFLARQAGCVLTEELYGPCAHGPLRSDSPSTQHQAGPAPQRGAVRLPRHVLVALQAQQQNARQPAETQALLQALAEVVQLLSGDDDRAREEHYEGQRYQQLPVSSSRSPRTMSPRLHAPPGAPHRSVSPMNAASAALSGHRRY